MRKGLGTAIKNQDNVSEIVPDLNANFKKCQIHQFHKLFTALPKFHGFKPKKFCMLPPCRKNEKIKYLKGIVMVCSDGLILNGRFSSHVG